MRQKTYHKLNFPPASDDPVHAYILSQAKNLRNQRGNGALKPKLKSERDFWSAGSPSAHALWRRCFGVHFESVILSTGVNLWNKVCGVQLCVVILDGTTRHELVIIVEL